MKKLYLTTFTLLFINLTFAQDYDINSYDFRYQQYKGFILNPSFQNNGNNQFSNQDNPNNTTPSSFDNRTTINGKLDLWGNYFSTQNIESILRSTNISLNNNTNWNYEKGVSSSGGGNNYFDKQLINTLSLRYNQQTRHYNPDNSFKYRGKNANLTTGINWHNRDANSQTLNISNVKNQNIATVISASFGRGKGRLNNVSDVIASHFLLEDLRTKTGITYSNDQLEQVAYGITYLRNQRYLDFRFRTIDQLAMLDSTLANNGLKSKNDVAYFSTINDNLLYATNLERSSGKRWTYYYTPGIGLGGSRGKSQQNFSYYDNNINGIDTLNQYNLSYTSRQSLLSNFTIEYINTTQKSWKVQQSFSTALTFGTALSSNFTRDSTSESEFTEPIRRDKPANFNNDFSARLSATWSHLYQPNSRTYYIASITPALNFYDYRLSPDLIENWAYQQNRIASTINLNFDYYKWINQNLAFNVRANANLMPEQSNFSSGSQEFSVNKYGFNLNHSISAGLTYQLY